MHKVIDIDMWAMDVWLMECVANGSGTVIDVPELGLLLHDEI